MSEHTGTYRRSKQALHVYPNSLHQLAGIWTIHPVQIGTAVVLVEVVPKDDRDESQIKLNELYQNVVKVLGKFVEEQVHKVVDKFRVLVEVLVNKLGIVINNPAL